MSSGYTNCACRDCFEIAVSDDMSAPDLCHACEDAGCEACDCEDKDACRVPSHRCGVEHDAEGNALDENDRCVDCIMCDCDGAEGGEDCPCNFECH